MDKLIKTLTLALDKSATNGEAENAILAFLKIAKKEGVDIYRLAELIPSKKSPHFKEPEIDSEMPFGKYKGRKISWIYSNDFGYFNWLYKNANIESEYLYRVMEHYYNKR